MKSQVLNVWSPSRGGKIIKDVNHVIYRMASLDAKFLSQFNQPQIRMSNSIKAKKNDFTISAYTL